MLLVYEQTSLLCKFDIGDFVDFKYFTYLGLKYIVKS